MLPVGHSHTSSPNHHPTPHASHPTGPGLCPDSLYRNRHTVNAKCTDLFWITTVSAASAAVCLKVASQGPPSRGTLPRHTWHHQAWRPFFTELLTYIGYWNNFLKKIQNYYFVFRSVYWFHCFQFWSKKLKTNVNWYLSSGEPYHFQSLLKYIILFDFHNNPEWEAEQVVIWSYRWGNQVLGVIRCG